MKPVLALMFLLAGLLSTSPSLAEGKRSGTILAVAPSGQSLTLEEISAGIAPGRNQILTEPIALTPETVIMLVSRVEEADTADWPGGFKQTPLAPGDLRTGDYATIETARRAGKVVAVSITVVRPVSSGR